MILFLKKIPQYLSKIVASFLLSHLISLFYAFDISKRNNPLSTVDAFNVADVTVLEFSFRDRLRYILNFFIH